MNLTRKNNAELRAFLECVRERHASVIVEIVSGNLHVATPFDIKADVIGYCVCYGFRAKENSGKTLVSNAELSNALEMFAGFETAEVLVSGGKNGLSIYPDFMAQHDRGAHIDGQFPPIGMVRTSSITVSVWTETPEIADTVTNANMARFLPRFTRGEITVRRDSAAILRADPFIPEILSVESEQSLTVFLSHYPNESR